MTVHAAKGLEFPAVFLLEMNEGVFPSRRTGTVQAMEEERRLAFVAVTRAEKALFISEAGGRSFDGSPRYPSRFILDIDKTLLQFTHAPAESLITEAMAYIESSEKYLPESAAEPAFELGCRVRHNIFGDGTVIDIDPDRAAHIVKFDALPTPRAISFKSKLERPDAD